MAEDVKEVVKDRDIQKRVLKSKDMDDVYQKANPWDYQVGSQDLILSLKPLAERINAQHYVNGPTLIDLGCGEGHAFNTLFPMLTQRPLYYGFDIAQKAIDGYLHIPGVTENRAFVEDCSVLRPSFTAVLAAADVVMGLECIYLFPSPSGFLDAIVPYLHKDCLFYMGEGIRRPVIRGRYKNKWPNDFELLNSWSHYSYTNPEGKKVNRFNVIYKRK